MRQGRQSARRYDGRVIDKRIGAPRKWARDKIQTQAATRDRKTQTEDDCLSDRQNREW